jgi:hypothetical protein
VFKDMITKDITYFERSGSENTDNVLNLVKNRSKELKIETIVLASTRGGTAEKALKALSGKKLITVGIDRGIFSPEVMSALEKKGFPVLFSHETNYNYSEDMKSAFRRFGQGMKVVVEDVVIACLKNVLKPGVDVISLAGSSWGADTAIVITSSTNFNNVGIKEVICKP